jgi:hypothetical protein
MFPPERIVCLTEETVETLASDAVAPADAAGATSAFSGVIRFSSARQRRMQLAPERVAIRPLLARLSI